MPYKKGKKIIGQVRKDGMRTEKVFLTRKDALAWEAKMKRKPVEDWVERTDTACLGDWATKYLDYAKTKFSPATYAEKKAVFRFFFQHIDPAIPVSKLTAGKVLEYIMEQKEKRSGYAANKHRKNLVAAWNWGIKYFDPSLPQLNPCKVERMPEVRHPRYVPPQEDFWRVYEVAEGQDQVMLLTFLHLAARRKEIFSLTKQDLDFENNRVRLWTKKRKDGTLEYDWLPMTEELKERLLWWLENRPIKDSDHIFICLDNTAFCREDYGKPFRVRLQFMRRICDKAGVKRFGFHAIRHLSASILYGLGHDVATIQAILRHRSANTTERYLKTLGVEDVRRAMEDLSRQRAKVSHLVPMEERCEVDFMKEKPFEKPSTPQTAKARLVRVK